MPPLAAADAFLALEFLAGNRRVPLPVFSALVAALPPVSPHTSPRLRKSVALRALDLALSDTASVRLSRARAVLADPDLAACFPDHLAVPEDLAALKRFVDEEWASLPPSALEAAAERIVGDGALQTWADADQDTRRKLGLLVGESTEREILGKLGQDPSKVPLVDKAVNAPSTSGAHEADRAQVDKTVDAPSKSGADEAGHARADKAANVPNTSGANEADHAQVDKPSNEPSTSGANEADCAPQDDEAHLGMGNDNDSHVQEDCARHQQEPEREILGKLGKDPSKVPPVDKGAVNALSTSGANEADRAQVDKEVNTPSKSGAHEADRAQVDKTVNAPSKSGANEGDRAQADKAANAPSTSGANEANRAPQDDEAHLGMRNDDDSHVQEDCARHQQEPAERTTDARLPEKSVTSAATKGKDKASSSRVTEEIAPGTDKSSPVTRGSKPGLMERHPTATVYEWDDSDESDTERPPHKRQLPSYEFKRRPPPTYPNKRRKYWSEIEEKTLIEGVEKYGKGNWKDIKIAYPAVFTDRSAVNLKDKFRNLERHIIN